jgi:predicted lipid-binding transport protein (Tim44 family)
MASQSTDADRRMPELSRALDDDKFRLSPPECPSREELAHRLQPLPAFEPPAAEPIRRPQYSVGDVMILMVGVAVGLAGGTWMPADVFAGFLGLATLLGLLLVHLYPPESRLAKLLWSTMVLSYLIAVVTALVRPAAG